MRLKKQTQNEIILSLPRKIPFIGLFLIIIGSIIPIVLFIINNSQIIFVNGSDLQSILFQSSLGSFLVYITLHINFLIYFFSNRNIHTGYGHVILLTLNIISYLGIYNSIFSFSFLFITGIYFITHFKTLKINKTTEIFSFSERLFLLFYTSNTIPFSEIHQFSFEFKKSLRFLKSTKDEHQYSLKLFLFERDPGLKHIPINTEAEEDSLEFFRPHTLRKTLISKPSLIDSSYLNYRDHASEKFYTLIKKLLGFTGFNRSEEIKKDKKTIIIYKK